jgi:hypothetical protein
MSGSCEIFVLQLRRSGRFQCGWKHKVSFATLYASPSATTFYASVAKSVSYRSTLISWDYWPQKNGVLAGLADVRMLVSG